MSLESMLRRAERFGEAEIFFMKGRTIEARYNRDMIEAGLEKIFQGYGLRLNVKGRVSMVSFDLEKEFDRALKSAVKMTKYTEPVKGYHFPEKKDYQKVKTWSKQVSELEFADLVNIVLEGIDGIKETGAEPMQGEVSVSETHTYIENSNGVNFSDKENGISLGFGAKRGTGSGFDFWESGVLDFAPRELGKNAGREAVENSKAKKMGWDGKIALHPDIIDEFLSVILDWIDGDEVRRKTSPWTGKLGKKVLGELTIVEDPWIPYFPGSTSSDDEGVPTKKKVLLDKGVLKTFIYDTITATKVRAESTGNGFRHGGSKISIDVTNIVVDFPDRESMDGWDNCIVLRSLMGYHTINEKTGDFTLTVDHGILINGEKRIPVKGCVFVGNLFDVLSQVELASKEDYRWGDLITPYLLTRGRLVT